MHRRLILTIVIKIDDRNEKNENFIVVDEIDETNEKNKKKQMKLLLLTKQQKKEKKINKATIVNDEAINEKDVAIVKSRYLTKTFLTTLIIIVFNS